MFTDPFRKNLFLALGLPAFALAAMPVARQQQRVPVQPGPAATQLGPGAAPSPGDIEKMLVLAAAARVPCGPILPFAGETPPPGYLLCNGTELLRDDYPALFAAIGTSWGFDTSFTFTLPDLRGRFLRGVDGGAGNDPDALSRTAIMPGGNVGDDVGSLQADGRRGFSGTFAGTTSTNGLHSHDIDTRQGDWDEDDGMSGADPGWADDEQYPYGSVVNRKDTNNAGSHSHTTSTTVTF